LQAETYDEWKAAATELDALEGHDPWKEEDESPEYDAALVAARLRELDDARGAAMSGGSIFSCARR
jgi:TAG lipase/steryl ester hydrolase/phospholipase A2/LPA acyltransferase